MRNFLKPFVFILFILGFFYPNISQAITIGGVEYNNLKVWALSENMGNISFSCYLTSSGVSTGCPIDPANDLNEWGVALITSAVDSNAISNNLGKLIPINSVIGRAYGGGPGIDSGIGWISFNRSETGDPPLLTDTSGSLLSSFNSRFTDKDYLAQFNPSTRRIIGWARALNACEGSNCVTGGLIDSSYDGWIVFMDDQNGVTMDNDGNLSGYAYGRNVIGWINFSAGGGNYSSINVGNIAGNTPPVASMLMIPRIVESASGDFVLSVGVDGSSSFDIDAGDNLTLEWDWGDGSPVVTGLNATKTYYQEGTYDITLKVTDRIGAISSVVQSVVFVSPNLNACLISCVSDSQCNTQKGNVCFQADPNEPGICIAGPNAAPAIEQADDIVAGYIPYLCFPREGSSTVLDLCKPDIEYCPASGQFANGDSCNPGLSWQIRDAANSNSLFQCGVDAVMGPFCVGPELEACPNTGICASGNSLVGQNGVCNPGANECAVADSEVIFACAGETSGFVDSYVGRYTVLRNESPLIPEMPVGLQANGEACTKASADSPNNCEGINGCNYYNYKLDGSIESLSTTGTLNVAVANCTSESIEIIEDPVGCVFYGEDESGTGAPMLANCLPSDSFAWIPAECTVITENNKLRVDCTNIEPNTGSDGSVSSIYGKGCVFYEDGSIDCTYATATDGLRELGDPLPYKGCKFNPNPRPGEPAIECPGARDNVTLAPNYENCVATDLATAVVADPVVACVNDASCPNSGDICVSGSCVAKCEPGPIDACGIARDCISVCPAGFLLDSSLDPAQCVQKIWPEACSGAFPTNVLSPGTTSATIGLETSGPSVCRYADNLLDPVSGEWIPDPSQVDFDSMPASNTFNVDSSGTAQSTDVSGLRDLPDLNKYLVSCKSDTNGLIANACTLTVAVDRINGGGEGPLGLCTDSSQCLSGFDCVANAATGASYCEVAACLNAQPPSNTNLPINTTSVNIGLTAADAVCEFNVNYLGGNVFGDVTSTEFDINVADPSLKEKIVANVVGANKYYVQCQNTIQNEITSQYDVGDICAISFNVGACKAGYIWDPTAGSAGTGECVIDYTPLCQGAIPSSNTVLPIGTTNVTIGLQTDKASTCKYGVNNIANLFNDVNSTLFDVSGSGLVHSKDLTGLISGTKNYYVQCESSDPNIVTGQKDLSNLCKIPFRVGECPSGNIWNPASGICEFDWSIYPSCSQTIRDVTTNAVLTQLPLPSGTTEVNLEITTDQGAGESVDCKISTNPLDTYNSSTMTLFNPTGGVVHTSALSSLVELPLTNNYLVRCQNNTTGVELDACVAQVSVASGGGGNPGGGNPTLSFCLANPSDPSCVFVNFCLANPSDPSCVNITPPGSIPFCDLNPGDPSCVQVNVSSPINQCNVLGIAFQGTAPGSGIGPSQNCSIVAVLLAILQWFAWIVALLAVVYGLRGGYTYITSAGNNVKLELAKRYIIYTMIGVVVAVISFSIIAITRAVTGL